MPEAGAGLAAPAMSGRMRVAMATTSAATAKDRILELVGEQPDDSSFDEILRELALARMIQRGLVDSEAGRTISHEEMGQRIRSWAG